jgi:hypothetical protein
MRGARESAIADPIARRVQTEGGNASDSWTREMGAHGRERTFVRRGIREAVPRCDDGRQSNIARRATLVRSDEELESFGGRGFVRRKGEERGRCTYEATTCGVAPLRDAMGTAHPGVVGIGCSLQPTTDELITDELSIEEAATLETRSVSKDRPRRAATPSTFLGGRSIGRSVDRSIGRSVERP